MCATGYDGFLCLGGWYVVLFAYLYFFLLYFLNVCTFIVLVFVNKLPYIKKEYVDTGKVRFVFRNFPYDPPSLIGSVILKCVPKDVRYDYMNVLFLLRKNWVISDNAKSTQELYKIMQSGGMSKEDFDNCLKRDDLANQIIKGRIDVQNEFNIQSTPSFLINGNLEQGNKSVKEFRQIIDKILSE